MKVLQTTVSFCDYQKYNCEIREKWSQKWGESFPVLGLEGNAESLADTHSPGPRTGLAQPYLRRIHTWLRHARQQGSLESLTLDF